MKFSAMSPKNRKVLHIDMPNKGMNLTKPSLHIDEGEISLSKNMIFENGVLQTRKGITASFQSILPYNFSGEIINKDIKLTDTEYIIDKEIYRVAYRSTVCNGKCVAGVYLLGKDETLKSRSYIIYGDGDGDICIPESLVFYCGKAQKGGGLFAFLQIKEETLGTVQYALYEISSDLSEWNMIKDYYVPTVFINGRGNSYEEAKKTYNVSNLTPKTLELPNMLNSRFRAYYSSDGLSCGFRLPYTNLANAKVECIIHTTPAAYGKWTISATGTTNTITFNEKQVTMNLNRSKGLVYFTCEGEDFPIKIMHNYKENNIRFEASHKEASEFKNIASCTCSQKNKEKIYFSGGREKCRIYYCDYENPIYFPSVSDNLIGSSDNKVNSLCNMKDDLIAFKNNEIYRIELSDSKALNSIALLADNGKIFEEAVSFKMHLLTSNLGADSDKKVARLGNNPVFFGSDYKVYIIRNTNKIECISEKVGPLLPSSLEETESELVVGADKNYAYISFGENCLVIDCKEEAKAYLWEVPKKLAVRGIFSKENKTAFLMECMGGGIFFYAFLKGEKDMYPYDEYMLLTYTVESYLKLKSYYLSEKVSNKFIHSVNLTLSVNENSKIILGDQNNSEEFFIRKGEFSSGGPNNIKLSTNLRGVDSVDIILESEGPLAFYSSDIYYTEAADFIM